MRMRFVRYQPCLDVPFVEVLFDGSGRTVTARVTNDHRPGVDHGFVSGFQRSTNAFSITKWPGALWFPSLKERSANTVCKSDSMCGLPHSMTRSFSGSSDGRPIS